MVDYDRLLARDDASRPHVIIVGGGFGGLYAAKSLARVPVDVTVIDRRNYHLFQPLLYQVATAALSAPDVAAPIRTVLRGQRNARVLLANAIAVDAVARRLVLADGTMAYDFLVVAVGATDSYFGHDEWREHAPGLKSIDDAFEIRRRMLLAYEEAERTADAEARRELLTFVVVGAGPTGVELAGSMAEIARKTLARNFKSFDPAEARVILVEGRSRVLPTYPEELSRKAAVQLERLGVTIWTSTKVTAIDERTVRLGDERIVTRTVVWAAGVQAEPLTRTLGAPVDRAGRVLVTKALTVPDRDELFVIGDAAAVPYKDGIVPGVAPAAIQMGRHTARNIARRIEGRPLVEFAYRDKGSLATIGRRAAVADFGRFRFSGAFAWLMWLFIHIFFLIGFRRRVVVMLAWAWAYFTYQRSARVILSGTRERPGELR